MKNRSIGRLNVFLMLILILFWGSSFVVVKIVLNEGLAPIAIATYRFLIAGGLFIVVGLVRKRRSDYELLPERKDVPALLILALAGVTFFFTAQYTGIKMAGASIAAIFACLLSPVLITVFCFMIFKERLVKEQILGIGVAALGTFVVITGNTVVFQGSREFFLGSLILLSTPLLWASYSLFGKKMMEKYSPFLVVTYVNVLGGLCLTLFSLADNSLRQILTVSPCGWLAILFLSVTCSLIGYYIWFYVINQVGASVASAFLFAEPLITALFAFAFVGEKISLFTLAGGSLIFTGVYLVSMK
jgi:drug/metabolite transporter (DMT)-like permease